MEFRLKAAKQDYYKEDEEEKNKLRELGFQFLRHPPAPTLTDESWQICNDLPTITINTIEEMVALADKYGPLIFDGETIKIYNDWVE